MVFNVRLLLEDESESTSVVRLEQQLGPTPSVWHHGEVRQVRGVQELVEL